MKAAPGVIPTLLLFLFLGGCGREQPGTVIARVGDSELTREEALADLDTSQGDLDRRMAQYTTAWINSELIYQEARRLGLEEDPEYLSRLKKVRRQIANQVLLDWMIYRDTTGFSEDTLRAYFENSRDEYSIAEDHLQLNLITFGSRRAARRFRTAVSTVKSWETVLDSVIDDPGISAEVVHSARSTWYTPATLYPPELWKVASPLGAGEVSFPFKTHRGYTLLQKLAFVSAGKDPQFELVRDEVLNRMRIEHRRGLFEQLLGTLRERYSVALLLNNTSDQDGIDSAQHE
jgi:hypothetical protein